jgi:hypothetical protein
MIDRRLGGPRFVQIHWRKSIELGFLATSDTGLIAAQVQKAAEIRISQ